MRNRRNSTVLTRVFIHSLIHTQRMFYPIKVGWELKYFCKIASTVFAANSFVAESAAVDTIEPADASDATIIGIVARTVTAADVDYAANTRIPVWVPIVKGAELFGDIGTGTIAITDEGNLIDLKDADEADASASTTDILKIKKFLSTTQAIFTLNKPAIV